jgi:Probable transposase
LLPCASCRQFSVIDTSPDLTSIKLNIWPVSSIGKISSNPNCSLDDIAAAKLATRVGDYQRQRWDRGKIKGQSDLIYKKGIFYLIVVQDLPEEKEYDPVGVPGIDLGIGNIAVDSDREIFESEKIENTRERYLRLRTTLQHIGTRSAKTKLRRISGKERRFKKDTNHVISKHIISRAKGTTRTIGIENLKLIRRQGYGFCKMTKVQHTNTEAYLCDELRVHDSTAIIQIERKEPK